MNEIKKLTDEQFHKFSSEFEHDLRNAMQDIVKDMQNHLSYLDSEEMKERAIQSALMAMVSTELTILLSAYKSVDREIMMSRMFKQMSKMAQVIAEHL